MKTTLDIPSELIAEAMEASGAKTKRAVVLRALEELNRKLRLQKLTERLGRSKTFMSPTDLRKLRKG